jgi:hypothetical protein
MLTIGANSHEFRKMHQNKAKNTPCWGWRDPASGPLQ